MEDIEDAPASLAEAHLIRVIGDFGANTEQTEVTPSLLVGRRGSGLGPGSCLRLKAVMYRWHYSSDVVGTELV